LDQNRPPEHVLSSLAGALFQPAVLKDKQTNTSSQISKPKCNTSQRPPRVLRPLHHRRRRVGRDKQCHLGAWSRLCAMQAATWELKILIRGRPQMPIVGHACKSAVFHTFSANPSTTANAHFESRNAVSDRCMFGAN